MEAANELLVYLWGIETNKSTGTIADKTAGY